MLSLDVKRSDRTESGFVVTTHGGRTETDLDALAWAAQAIELGAGELLVNSIDAGQVAAGDLDAVDRGAAAEDVELGAGELLVNSIDADGTKQGFDTELIALMRSISSVPVIASGGAGKASDFPPAIEAGADAVLAASVFHNRELTIGDVKHELAEAGMVVR